jgi:hypothetical protein
MYELFSIDYHKYLNPPFLVLIIVLTIYQKYFVAILFVEGDMAQYRFVTFPVVAKKHAPPKVQATLLTAHVCFVRTLLFFLTLCHQPWAWSPLARTSSST